MSIVIGLTGPTGAGKSSVAQTVASMGIKFVDCDVVARRAVERGSDGLSAVVSAFGDGILLPDGTLDRKELARRAFSSAEKTELLNRTLLPHIVEMVKCEAGDGDVLLDAPTLFESGMDSICTQTVAVLADRDVRRDRIISRDGLTIEEADIRMNAGKPDAFYLERAGHILYNNGDGTEFITAAAALMNKLFGGNQNE